MKEKSSTGLSLFACNIEMTTDLLVENMLHEIDKLSLQSFDVGTTEYRIQKNLTSCAKLLRKSKQLKDVIEDEKENVVGFKK